MGKEALVIPREILFKEKYIVKEFLPMEEHDYLKTILQNYSYTVRSDALEHEYSLKQIIPYVIIVNTRLRKIFAYRRAGNEKHYSEKRLYNKWSLGVGGHIERQDDQDPIQSAAVRELLEEIQMKKYPVPQLIGCVNDDSVEIGDVEKYHFGVVFIAETDEEEIAMGDGEIAEGKFMSIEEVENVFADPANQIERWTSIVFPFVKKYLQSL